LIYINERWRPALTHLIPLFLLKTCVKSQLALLEYQKMTKFSFKTRRYEKATQMVHYKTATGKENFELSICGLFLLVWRKMN
jgi:hypothetical protein